MVLSPDDAPTGRGFDSRSVTFPPPGFDSIGIDLAIHYYYNIKQCAMRKAVICDLLFLYTILLLLTTYICIYLFTLLSKDLIVIAAIVIV